MLALKVKYNGEWTQLDLYGNESIKFNKSVIEVQDFTKRTSDFTKLFRIPGTSINNKVLGNIFKINLEDSSFDTKGALEAAITINGRIVIIGSLRLERLFLGLDKVDYEVTVYSQLGDLASKIQDVSLCELDFSDLDHPQSYPNMITTWNNPSDYVYPFIHYGLDEDTVIPNLDFLSNNDVVDGYSFNLSNNALPFWYLKPAVKINRIIRQILNDAGYQMKSEFMDSDYFNKLYMPLIFSDTFGAQTSVVGDLTVTFNQDELNPVITNVNIPTMPYPDIVSDPSNLYSYPLGNYTPPATGSYKMRQYIKFDLTDFERSPNKNNYWFYIGYFSVGGYNEVFKTIVGTEDEVNILHTDVFMQEGDNQMFPQLFAYVRQTDCYEYTLHAGNGTTFSYTDCLMEPQTITLAQNDPDTTIYAIQNSVTVDAGTGHILEIQIAPNTSSTDTDIIIKEGSTLTIFDAPPGGVGDTIDISSNMPCDISQIDFLKGIFTKFNMVIYADNEDESVLNIEPWVNWVNKDDVQVRDWTKYLTTEKDVIVQPLVDNENRYVRFIDEEDDDRYNVFNQQNYNQVYGQKLFDSESDIVNSSQEVSTIFSPTPSAQLDGSLTMIVPHMYEYNREDKSETTFKTNPRILYYNGLLDIAETYYIKDTINNNTYAHSRYPCISSFENLNTPTPTRDSKTLFYEDVFGYFTSLTGYNTFNAKGNLFRLYWEEYFVDTYDENSRFVTAFFNLPYKEFVEVKLNDKIQISGLFGNTQWRINKIADYDLISPGITKVELIKIVGDPVTITGDD